MLAFLLDFAILRLSSQVQTTILLCFLNLETQLLQESVA